MGSLKSRGHPVTATATAALTVALFSSVRDIRPLTQTVTWEQLTVQLSHHERRATKDGPCISFARYRPGATRGTAGVEAVTALAFDIDGADPELTRLEPYAYVLVTTYSSGRVSDHNPSGARCWRLVVPLAAERPADGWAADWERATAALCPNADSSGRDCARLFYLPSCPPDSPAPGTDAPDVPRVIVHPGAPLDFSRLPELPPEPAPPRRAPSQRPRGPGVVLPGDDFNARGDRHALLTAHGWTLSRVRGGEEFWRRPGKLAPGQRRPADGNAVSATWGYRGAPCFYVFSTNAAPLKEDRAYSLFGLCAELEHGGDYDAAASALAAQGYGTPLPAPDVPPEGRYGGLDTGSGPNLEAAPPPEDDGAPHPADAPSSAPGGGGPSDLGNGVTRGPGSLGAEPPNVGGRGDGGAAHGAGGQEGEGDAERDALAQALTHVPELPAVAQLSAADVEAAQETRALWLDPYIRSAGVLVPRAPALFHEAVALAVLCLAIARRVGLRVTWSKTVYPSLMLCLVARSTLYTKTECLNLGRVLLHKAGLRDTLLAASWTPQALVSELALAVPADIREGGETVQDAWRKRHRHAGQRGAIRDELSGLFDDARSEMSAALLPLLLKLDAAPDVLDADLTLKRGETEARDVGLTLLGASTPAAMRQAARSPVAWNMGVFGRVLLLGTCERPRYAPWPEGEPALDPAVVDGLKRLYGALPAVRVEYDTEPVPERRRGRRRGGEGEDDPEPERIAGAHQEGYAVLGVTLTPGARKGWQAYSKALFDLTAARAVPERLDALYGRLPEVALRVALALATVERVLTGMELLAEPERPLPTGRGVVPVHSGHWAAAQRIAEGWRESVHATLAELLRDDAADEQARARRAQLDRRLRDVARRILRALGETDGNRPRARTELYQPFSGRVSAGEIDRALTLLTRDGLVTEVAAPSTGGPGRPPVLYALANGAAPPRPTEAGAETAPENG